MDPKLLGRIAKAITKYPDYSTDIAQSFKYNQWVSKKAICSMITEPSATFLGGWFCTLPPFFYKGYIESVDFDLRCEEVNLHPEINYITSDVCNIVPQTEAIVNSSFEHMSNYTHDDIFSKASHANKFYLSSNNMFHVKDHINCHKSLEEFIVHTSCWIDVTEAITVKLDKGYERYIVSGYKK